MNILDYIVIGLIALYVLNGVYRGFIPSLLNLGGFFVSWIVSFLTYPLLSASLIKSDFFMSLTYYIEGAESINNPSLIKLPVASISESQLDSIMANANLTPPFDTAVAKNIADQAFADQGLTTLGEYFNQTIYCVIVNIISLLIIFVILRILLTLLTNAFSFGFSTPQLRHFDYLLGGGVGALRGFFSIHLVFCVLPIFMIILPDLVTSFINESFFANMLYSGNMVLRFISGT